MVSSVSSVIPKTIIPSNKIETQFNGPTAPVIDKNTLVAQGIPLNQLSPLTPEEYGSHWAVFVAPNGQALIPQNINVQDAINSAAEACRSIATAYPAIGERFVNAPNGITFALLGFPIPPQGVAPNPNTPLRSIIVSNGSVTGNRTIICKNNGGTSGTSVASLFEKPIVVTSSQIGEPALIRGLTDVQYHTGY